MKKVFGNTQALKASQIKKLENLYNRRVPPNFLITHELAYDTLKISQELRKQIGLLLDRSGRIVSVILGDHQGIFIPDLSDFRAAPGRLKGIRCIHTHLKDDPLSMDDLTDLALLRLDFMAAISPKTKGGSPYAVHAAHVFPGGDAEEDSEKIYEILEPLGPNDLDLDCQWRIQSLEAEMARYGALRKSEDAKERALLIGVSTGKRHEAQESLDELKELTESADVEVKDMILQSRKSIDPQYVIGLGKLKELTIIALKKGITIILFDQELSPAQIRSITDVIELKVIDRTQLILDIFAQRAQSREGKLQVELAQLKYLLPRLITKNTAMSRLTGGIGGRGPGETKLEINRRTVRDKITRLELSLENVRKQRAQQKAKRDKRELPVISIVGYTNAGKSTLLNNLTKSEVLSEDRLFATLDPSSRRLRFPREMEVIITDTVGFINALPKELMVAFRATLEELERADLLLHVIDVSNPRRDEQIKSVESILCDLKLNHIPCIRVLNKIDRQDAESIDITKRQLDGVPISALDKTTLMPLLEAMEMRMEEIMIKKEGMNPDQPPLNYV